MGNSAALLEGVDTRPDTPGSPASPAEVLVAARVERRAADAAEVRLLRLAVSWALMHPVRPDQDDLPETHRVRGAMQRGDLSIAGQGCPQVREFAIEEFAAALGMGTETGKAFVGQALELCYRLPRLWDRVVSGDLVVWKARRVAEATLGLTGEAAAFVDTHVAPVAHKIKPAQLDRAVNEAIGRYMPDEVERLAEASWDKRHVTLFDQLVSFTGTMHLEAELDIADALDLEAAVAAGADHRAALGSQMPLDVRRAQALGDLARGEIPLDLIPGDHDTHDTEGDSRASAPRVKPRQVVLYTHLSADAVTGTGPDCDDPIARLERANSLISVEQVRAWCGSASTAQIMVKPVIDLDQCAEADTDTVPRRIAEHIALRDHTCVFPWCTRPARSCHPDQPNDHSCDCDHIHPRGQGGPTCSCNLAPLCRRHHRLKTHSPWTYVMVDPGTYLWTTPHGYQLLRDPTGTLDVTRPTTNTDRQPH